MAVLVNSSKISSSKKPQFTAQAILEYIEGKYHYSSGENNLNAKTQQG